MRLSINGHFVKTIALTGAEPEFNSAYGVFETIRTYYRRPFALPAHLQRLRQSARAIGLRVAASNTQLTHWVKQHGQATKEQRIKLIAAPEKIYIMSWPLVVAPSIYRSGVSVCTYPTNRLDPAVKSLARIHEYMANTYAMRHGHHDALLLDKTQHIWEGASSNIFMVKRGVLVTPQHNILQGVTRAFILRLAKKPYRIQLRPLHLNELYQADECFLTQTSVGIVPIIKINTKKIGSGQPGPITQDFMNRFHDYVTTHYSTRRRT